MVVPFRFPFRYAGPLSSAEPDIMNPLQERSPLQNPALTSACRRCAFCQITRLASSSGTIIAIS